MAKGTKRTIGIYINGKEVENSIKAITSAMQKLINEQKKMIVGSDEYVAHAQKIKELRGYIDEHNASLKTTKTLWQQLSGQWSNLGNTLTGIKSLFSMANSAISSVKSLTKDFAAMDDIYATVMKVTDMTREEVADLNEEFKKMDTRKSREELNAYAEIAGRIGVRGKEDLLGFVEAANLIMTSLSATLGGDAIEQVSKLAMIFSKTQADLKDLSLKDQILAVGNAITELGNVSTANEQYMVNFASRLGGMGIQAKISMQDILGYASVLDQNMLSAEKSATALSKFIIKLMTEPAKFAKIAGMEVNEFSKLLETDVNSAIKAVLKSLGEKGGLQQLAPMFKEMGSNASGAVEMITTLSAKLADVEEAQRVSNQAVKDGNAVMEEYAITNNSVHSLGEIYIKPYLDMIGGYEPVTAQFLFPLHAFLEVVNLFKPQAGSPSSQTRWVMINNIKMLPLQMKFEFTQGKNFIKSEIKMAKMSVPSPV